MIKRNSILVVTYFFLTTGIGFQYIYCAEPPHTNWRSFLSPDSQELLSQFSSFLFENNIRIKHPPLPEQFAHGIYTSHKKGLNTINEKMKELGTQYGAAFYPKLYAKVGKNQILGKEQDLVPGFATKIFTISKWLDSHFKDYKSLTLATKLAPEIIEKMTNDFLDFITEYANQLENTKHDRHAIDNIGQDIQQVFKHGFENKISSEDIALKLLVYLYQSDIAWLWDFCVTSDPNLVIFMASLLPLYEQFPQSVYHLDTFQAKPQEHKPFTVFISTDDKEIPAIILQRILSIVDQHKSSPFSLTKNYSDSGIDSDVGIRIDCCLSDGKKEFPLKINAKNPIESINVKSATSQKFILIVRKEEFIKTLLHELNHVLQIDRALSSAQQHTKDRDSELTSHFAIQSKEGILLFEAVVEALACLENLIMTATEFCHLNPGANFAEILTQMWQLERTFGMYQAAKLLVAADINSLDEFCSPSTTGKKIYQTAAATEYHIFKAMLLTDPTAFIDEVLANYDELFDVRAKKYPQKFYRSVVDLLYKNESAIRNDLNLLIEKIKLQRLKEEKNISFLLKTGRMTMIEPA